MPSIYQHILILFVSMKVNFLMANGLKMHSEACDLLHRYSLLGFKASVSLQNVCRETDIRRFSRSVQTRWFSFFAASDANAIMRPSRVP